MIVSSKTHRQEDTMTPMLSEDREVISTFKRKFPNSGLKFQRQAVGMRLSNYWYITRNLRGRLPKKVSKPFARPARR